MCCALNSLDAMKNTTFGKLVEELQNDQQQKNPEKKVSALVGKREGVSLVVDLHSNHASFGTVTDSYRAFTMFIGGPTEFPVLRERGIQLEPGKEHSLQFSGQAISTIIALSGGNSHYKVLSAPDIQSLKPSRRECFFRNEGNLKYYADYTFTNCR